MKGYVAVAFVTLTIIVVGAVAVGAVAEDTKTAMGELTEEADATYGEGNWSFEIIYCQLSCTQAPRPVNDSVPNASVKVGATKEDAPPFLHWPLLVTAALIMALIVLSMGLYGRYRGNDRND